MRGALLLGTLAAIFLAAHAADADALSGKRLYADVERYASFGLHRFGSEADRRTTEWIAKELETAGFETRFQSFPVGKQYSLSSAAIRVGDATVPVLPLWWPPDDKPAAKLKASIAADTETNAAGKIVWIRMPFDGGAYLSDAQRNSIRAAASRSPVAIVAVIDAPSEEEYAYNVAQSDAPWPVPVVVVGSKHSDRLQAAQQSGLPVEIVVDGRYESNLTGRNVVARLDRGASSTIIVSTPTTGWFTCACERGAGIAVFLALARAVAASNAKVNYVFVATAGHEIGHGGMQAFLQADRPTPSQTRAWIHLGASLACYEWRKSGSRWVATDSLESRRFLFYSEPAAATVSAGFAGMELKRVAVDQQAPPGELRDVHAAGYRTFLGLAGMHRFFHSPGDTPRTTGAEALEPLAAAFAATLERMAQER
ncbi:MAG: hypothetical protein ACREXP_06105 [Steroidobacteraceae bacterium]